MDGWMDGWLDDKFDGWTNGWMNIDNKKFLPTCKYKLMNHVSEYWYMGSMFASSEMQKKRMEE